MQGIEDSALGAHEDARAHAGAPGAVGGGKKPSSAYERAQQAERSAQGLEPQKRFFRQRAHCNPLSHNDSFAYPRTPADADWTTHFSCAGAAHGPDFADIGCGFGGLLVGLAPAFPESRMLGMEIREKASAGAAAALQAIAPCL